MNPSSEKPDAPDQHVWEQGWDGHKLEQMLRLSRLSFPEKLAWLEEAHRLVRQLAASKEPPQRLDE